jgi:hypothetical protein
LANVFPRDTAEEKRLSTLLKDAYVEARYNPDFLVTKKDVDTLLVKRGTATGYYKTGLSGEDWEDGGDGVTSFRCNDILYHSKLPSYTFKLLDK